ncbi:MAG: MASE1 domain-containing protein, partial [Acidobacteria bacterium]|nr:MASE1 domain-containing protein [Acidobacteriota bacterium]
MKADGPRLVTFSGGIPVPGSVTPSLRTRRALRLVATALAVACAYYLGTIVGLRLTPPPGLTIATIWPPNAILFASLLLVPSRRWWLLLAMVFPAHLIAQLPSGVPIARSIGWYFTNSAEALIGAGCVLHFSKGKPKFASVRGIVVFLIFGFLVAPLVTSFLDAAVVAATGGGGVDYWTTWSRRLFSNMLSNLTIVPPLVILGQQRLSRLRKTPAAQCLELLLVLGGVFLVSRYVFGDTWSVRSRAPALIFAPLPLLLWAAVRTGPGGLSASLFILALVSIWDAMHGHVPIPGASIRENILYLQVSGSMVTIPMMLLAALLSERRTTELELRDSKVKLIQAQEQERRRIASELHDDVGQQLALAELRLAEIKAASNLKPMLDRLSDQLAEISAEIREISHGLYPSLLQNLGLMPALKKLGREISREKNVSVRLALESPEFVPPTVSLALYRVAQEA